MGHWVEDRRSDDERHSERNRKADDYGRLAAMIDEPRWYEYLGMCVVIPASLFGTAWLIGWLTNSNPLIDEIWRLRGKNSVLRERLAQLEGRTVSDKETLRGVIEEQPRPAPVVDVDAPRQ